MTSAERKDIVTKARNKQYQRFSRSVTNSIVSLEELSLTSPLSPPLQHLLQEKSMVYHWSTRVQVNIIRTARTIADIDGSDPITEAALLEAIQYRMQTGTTLSSSI
ncbi:hypothetical protein LF817_16315 [Halobacillus sp. A1]|nr:hypothetical protein [Halobacillus sp. A1]MCP3032891.1 hypothetical protein [Halobacillus sp. A1]